MSRNSTKAQAVFQRLLKTAQAMTENSLDAPGHQAFGFDGQVALSEAFGDNAPLLREWIDVVWIPVRGPQTQVARQAAFEAARQRTIGILEAAMRALPHSPAKQDSATRRKSLSWVRAFIVHGHDIELRESVARFLLENRVRPIILREQPHMGRTIIEQLERNATVAIAIVLLSPDDVGRSVRERQVRARARQNVLIELGYFIGRLGRERVIAIVRGEIEIPADLHGIVYVPYEGDTWKAALLKNVDALRKVTANARAKTSPASSR